MIIKQVINVAKQSIRYQFPLSDLPQFLFIVGAQKAGTSALYSYLAQHPKLISGDEKELGFFNRDSMYNKGEKFFRSQFPVWSKGSYALDATPEYLYYENSARRIHSFREDAKIVVVLREPVSRAFSAFNMYQQICQQEWFKSRLRFANSDSKSFFQPIVDGEVVPDIKYFVEREMKIIEEVGREVEPGLIRRGIYYPQLARYMTIFGHKQVLVLFSDDLKRDPEGITNRVLQFIGLEPAEGIRYPLKHVREYTADITGKELIRSIAGDLFERDKQALIADYGLDVPW